MTQAFRDVFGPNLFGDPGARTDPGSARQTASPGDHPAPHGEGDDEKQRTFVLAPPHPTCTTPCVSELLSIGRFAQACRLSIKALRHYDELGLLRPARIDASGYRHYARDQARTAVAISLLRSLDVPLPVIKDVLTSRDPDALAARLADERARIERDLARARQALSCVERIIRDGELMPYEVSVREESARALLAVECVTAPELHVEAGYALFARLRAALAALSLPVRAPVVCLLPDPPDHDSMILRMGSPLDAPVTDAQAAEVGATVERLPATAFAFVTHRGPYQELGIAQHAITAWVHERGYVPIGAMREIYVDDPNHTEPADLRTEVGVPFRR